MAHCRKEAQRRLAIRDDWLNGGKGRIWRWRRHRKVDAVCSAGFMNLAPPHILVYQSLCPSHSVFVLLGRERKAAFMGKSESPERQDRMRRAQSRWVYVHLCEIMLAPHNGGSMENECLSNPSEAERAILIILCVMNKLVQVQPPTNSNNGTGKQYCIMNGKSPGEC